MIDTNTERLKEDELYFEGDGKSWEQTLEKF
jgi:hypothetical protein